MAISRSLVLVTCTLLSAPALASAQQTTLSGSPPTKTARNLPIEVSPFVTTGNADSSGIGASVRWPFASRLGIEFEAEFRHTPARPLANSLENNGVNGSVNLVVDLPAIARVRPFVLGGGGLEPYALVGQREPFMADTGMSFVVNMGGGVRVPINDRFGVRAELRWSDGWTKGAPDGGLRMFYGATVGVGGR
jgi:hypothetical protein